LAVVLPGSATHVGDCAFQGCTSLARVTMPAVRPFIGDGAFEGYPWSE
jgi:hypothetical protein